MREGRRPPEVRVGVEASPLLIDIGAGENPFEDGRGWVHFDSRPLPHIDFVGRAEELDHHFGQEADELRAAHILEHFPYRDTVKVLTAWRNVLRPRGLLHVEVPNLTFQCAYLMGLASGPNGEDWGDEDIVRLIFGEQDHPGNFHYAGFTQQLLQAKLHTAGFREVSVQDIGMVLVARSYK